MFQISKQFPINGGDHIIRNLPEGHKCGRRHGHNWIIVMVLEANELDEHGFVRDYGDLEPVKDYIKVLDHQFLNDFFEPTTAEGIAIHFFNKFKPEFPELVAVRVSETPNTWAEYRP